MINRREMRNRVINLFKEIMVFELLKAIALIGFIALILTAIFGKWPIWIMVTAIGIYVVIIFAIAVFLDRKFDRERSKKR